MGYFLAYRHTGVDPSELEALLPPVRNVLQADGSEVYCTYFNEGNFKNAGLGPAEIMRHAFLKIEEMGRLFVLIDSEQKSEGMIMEIGYCLAKGIPITVAIRSNVTGTYLPNMTDEVIRYTDIDDLVQKIKARGEA